MDRKISKENKKKVIKRDHGLCILCWKPGQDIHHVHFSSTLYNIDIKTRNEPTNLVVLCRQCHNDIHHKSDKKKRHLTERYLENIYWKTNND